MVRILSIGEWRQKILWLVSSLLTYVFTLVMRRLRLSVDCKVPAALTPSPSPRRERGAGNPFKVPLPMWERDLAIILIVNPLWLAWPSEWVLYR